MACKVLTVEEAFTEIEQLRQNGETGVIVNIAERMWAGCAEDNAYQESTWSEFDIPIFHSKYRERMVDLIFPGDLCICAIERKHSHLGKHIFKRAESYLHSRGIYAIASKSDLCLFDLNTRKMYKIGSYGIVKTESGTWETTVHISIHAEPDVIASFRQDPPEMTRAGVDAYGVTAEDLLETVADILEEAN